MTMKKRALALMLAVLMAASSTGAATAAVESSVAAQAQSVSLQAEAGTVTGTLRTAPTRANLESQGPLGWIHFNNKVLEDCAQMGEGSAITDMTFSGGLAQIAEDTRTNFEYTGADARNSKGQVVSGKNQSFSFRVPGSTEPP